MLNKFLNIFKTNKQRFQEKVKKEKNQIYLRKRPPKKQTKKKSYKRNNLQLQIHFGKKGVITFSLIGFILTLIGIIFIFKGPYFSIQNIKIESNDAFTDTNISYKILSSLKGKNIFLTNDADIQEKLSSYQKNIYSIQTKKVLPHTIEIEIFSYPVVLKALYKNKSYFLSSNGIAIPKIYGNQDLKENIALQIFPLKKNSSSFNDYKKIIEEEQLKNIFLLIQSFRNNLIQFIPVAFSFYEREGELHIYTKNNTRFIFDIHSNIAEQIKKGVIFYKKYPGTKHIYIDLRIKNKIFYCGYNKEFYCNRNLKRLYQ